MNMSINTNMKMSEVVGSSLLKNHNSGTKKHKGGNKYKIGYQPNLSYTEYVKDIYEGLPDLSDFLFHVTFTKNVDNIKKKGLEQFHPSNWVKGPGGSRYNEDAGVFAFDNPEDAINWASKMRFDNKQTPISIVRLTIDPDNSIWDEDPAQDPIMRATLKGRALKSSENINAERIVDAVDFDSLGTPSSHNMDRDKWIEKVATPVLNAR
jgi:hypothetical protein